MKENEEKKKKERWHSMDAEGVLKKIDVDPDEGLSSDEAKKRLEDYGPNELPKEKKRSPLMRFIKQFDNVLIYILLAAAVVTALMEHWIDTWVILAVVLINAVIGFIQEGKAEKALESIKQMLSLEARVLRDGKQQTIEAEKLVPGDIVTLKSGEKISADVRLIKTKDFRVEESPLTGESEAVDKSTEPAEEDAIIGDQTSMAFSGTIVVYGKATGVVVATGKDSEIGKISKMMSEVKEITTPLLQKIRNFAKWLAVVILGIAAVFFVFGYFVQGYDLVDIFLAVIGLAVAAIPQGLPAIITITLAIGVQRMADRNAIIRRLPSVETLGSVDVICSDKTGTLTRNEMTVRTIMTADKEYQVEGTGYKPEGNIMVDDEKVDPDDDKVLQRFLQTARISNNAEIKKDDDGNWKLNGPPTEGALLTLAYKAGLQDFKPEQIDQIPFESDHKYNASLNELDGERYVFMAGAPEKILEMSSKQLTSDGEKDVDEDFWEEKMEEVAAKGQRLLGLAFNKTDKNRKEIDKDDLEKNKVFLGFVGIIDPPRDEVIDSIKECKEAGINVKMITGDHSITAKAIGKEIGIGDGGKALSGKELEEMSDEDLKKASEEYDVYARTSPEHKLRLVEALQAKNHLCAMTGDGVNDAPALKKANIGIAMGIKGTEVSKDASEMVLADDNFASIVNAVEEGRTVYENIRKAILFILPTNGAESLVLMAAILLGIIMPITPVQVLWVNMVTGVTLALAISFEPMEEQLMERPPRDPDEPILGKLFIWRIVFVSFLIGGLTFYLFDLMQGRGMDDAISRTVAVNTLVAGQLFYLFNVRKIKQPSLGKGFFSSKAAFIAVGVLILLQIFFVYTPFMNEAFDTAPIEASFWLYPLAAGLVVFIVVELEKWLIARITGRKE